MSWVVTAPCITVPDMFGQVHHRYEGQLVNWQVPDEHHAHLLAIGFLRPAAAPPGVVETVAEPVITPELSDEAPTADRPIQTATKEAWVNYAVARGMDRAQAESMTKPDLIGALS